VPKRAGHGANVSKARKGMKFSDEHRANISKAQTGKKRGPTGPYKTPTVRKGKPFSAEHRAALSAAKLANPVRYWLGKKHPHTPEQSAKIGKANKGKPAYFPRERFYYKGVPFRSSWERFVAQSFDERDIKWQYESRYFDLGTQGYRPDFYLPELDCYWEVKGWHGPRSQKTISLFRNLFPDIALVVADKSVINMLSPKLNLRQLSSTAK